MTFAWFHWWWDGTLGLPRAQVATGIIGTVLAIIAVIYAWIVARRQFAMMEEQGQIIDKQVLLMEEQTAADKRVADLTVDLKAILVRQGEIAEAQHRILQEQLSRRSRLTLRLGRQHRSHDTIINADGDNYTYIEFNVHNLGTRAANGFYWEIVLPQLPAYYVKWLSGNGNELLKTVAIVPEGGWHHKKMSGHYGEKLFPLSSVEIARVEVNVRIKSMESFTLRWRLACEDEFVPETGFSEMLMLLQNDDFYGSRVLDASSHS